MPAEASPAFQFYVREWLGDANVRAMTHEARGVYMDLMCFCWQEITITADVPSLARIAGLPLSRFQKVWAQIEPRFIRVGDRYRHGRLDKERDKQSKFREAASRAGKASAEQRAFNARSTDVDIPFQRNGNGKSTLQSASASVDKEPPYPPLRGGRRPTRKELEHAEAIRRNSRNGCEHEPQCENYITCVHTIALELRAKVPA